MDHGALSPQELEIQAMCGIVGVLQKKSVAEDLLHRMAQTILHRGPDQTGVMVEGSVGFAMNRLAIIDVAGGKQPIHSHDGRVSMIYNGEIYNFKELRKQLAERYTFRTQSDTEVILNGYLEWGMAVFARLNGIFAVAIWDRRDAKLLLARDPLGVKPLYLRRTRDALHFASELKAFTSNTLANRVNPVALLQYLSAGYVFCPDTALEGVQQLDPGTVVTVNSDFQVEVKRFRPFPEPLIQRDVPKGDVPRLIRGAMEDAVIGQTVADVPYGLLLSAGIDSMTILAILRERGLADNLNTYTLDYEEDSYSEGSVVSRLAKDWGFRNERLVLTPQLVDKYLEKITYTFDNLEFLPTCAAIYSISQVAGRSTRVLLAGNGGDEVFLGYPTYRATEWLMRLGPLAGFVAALKPLMNRISVSDQYLGTAEKIKRFVAGAHARTDLAHVSWRHVFELNELNLVLNKDYRAFSLEKIYEPQLNVLNELSRDGYARLDKYAWGDIKTWLPDHGLSMWDKAGMSASAEIRVPLIDPAFLELVMSIPRSHRAPRAGTKSVLRDLFKQLLPDYVTSLPKHGFQVPVASWLRGPLHSRFRDLTSALPPQVFNLAAIDMLWKDFEMRRQNNALKLWILGCLSSWARLHRIAWT